MPEFGKPELRALLAAFSCCNGQWQAPLDAVLAAFRRPDEGLRVLRGLHPGFLQFDEAARTLMLMRGRIAETLGLPPLERQPALFPKDEFASAMAEADSPDPPARAALPRAHHGHVMLHDHDPDHALNMDHDRNARGSRANQLLVEHIFPGLREDYRQAWTRRVAENARLVELSIEEALMPRARNGVMAPARNLVAYANRFYLDHIRKAGPRRTTV